MMYDRKKIEILKQRYPKGTRICLDSMENDPQPIPPGTMGTVVAVDDGGNILMKWDNGRSLSIIPDVDSFHVVEQEEKQETKHEKPDCPLIGADGNIYNLMGIASKTLKDNGMENQAKEMCDKIIHSGSYDEALCIIGDYVNITSVDEKITEEPEMNMSM